MLGGQPASSRNGSKEEGLVSWLERALRRVELRQLAPSSSLCALPLLRASCFGYLSTLSTARSRTTLGEDTHYSTENRVAGWLPLNPSHHPLHTSPLCPSSSVMIDTKRLVLVDSWDLCPQALRNSTHRAVLLVLVNLDLQCKCKATTRRPSHPTLPHPPIYLMKRG